MLWVLKVADVQLEKLGNKQITNPVKSDISHAALVVVFVEFQSTPPINWKKLHSACKGSHGTW